MSREELIDKICPTDATYECGQGDCTSNCTDCNELLNALLDEYDKQIRADVIDEFVKECCEYENLTFDKYAIQRIKSIAGQLKEQNDAKE